MEPKLSKAARLRATSIYRLVVPGGPLDELVQSVRHYGGIITGNYPDGGAAVVCFRIPVGVDGDTNAVRVVSHALIDVAEYTNDGITLSTGVGPSRREVEIR